MARQIQIRRGTAVQHENFTGAVGELTMDTTNNTLRLHDGATPGGIAMARADSIQSASPIPDTADYVIETQIPTAENNYTWYRKYKSGWVEQGGISNAGGTGSHRIIFPIEMSNTFYTYSFVCAIYDGTYWGSVKNVTTTYFDVFTVNYQGTTTYQGGSWCIKGMYL